MLYTCVFQIVNMAIVSAANLIISALSAAAEVMAFCSVSLNDSRGAYNSLIGIR